MTVYSHIYLGKSNGVPFDVIQKSLSEIFSTPPVATYSIEQLPSGEVLFKSASTVPLEVRQVTKVNRLLNSLMELIHEVDDLYNEGRAEQYILCFNTRILFSGRNGQNDEIMDKIWETLRDLDVDVQSTFRDGYMLLVFSSTKALSSEKRGDITSIVLSEYEKSIVFEYPSLP